MGFRSQPAGSPAITPHGHRGVSAFFFRDGAIPLSFVPKIKTGFAQRAQRAQRKKWQRTVFSRKKKRHAGLKSGVPRRSRGGAKSTEGVSRDFVSSRSQPAGYPAMTPHGHRDVSASSFRDGAIPLSYVPKIKTGFALRSQRTRRKNWQGTGFSRKKKGHVGLKSGVPRALPRLRIKNKERIAGHHWLPHDNRLGYQGKNTKVKRPSWQGESRGS